MKLTNEGLQLLLDGEVGGGRAYYEKFCMHPTVPDPDNTVSGITIGIGSDLGQMGRIQFMYSWEDFLSQADSTRLCDGCGLRGAAAVEYLSKVRTITIPWDKAVDQFVRFCIPRIMAVTDTAFPGLDKAPQAVQESLLSLIYNRGSSMIGDRRREMRAIRDMVASEKWIAIPGLIRQMKRLWLKTPGLQARREAEAVHIEKSLGRNLYELPEGADPADQDWTTPGFILRKNGG